MRSPLPLGGQREENGRAKSDGTVTNWGTETILKDAAPPEGLSNITAIAVGYNHTLALKKDGTVIGWLIRKGRPQVSRRKKNLMSPTDK